MIPEGQMGTYRIGLDRVGVTRLVLLALTCIGMGLSEPLLAQGLPPLPPHVRNARRQSLSEAKGKALRLELQRGEQYGIAFEVDVNSGGRASKTQGRVVYRIAEGNAETFLRNRGGGMAIDGQEGGIGTGTGFAVHPEGVVMTCAHVVGMAEQVKVVINDRPVIGRVIGVDAQNDLALIKVPVQFDRILAFNDTPPELGDECHVIGFPLASELGVRVKMTSGTIAGDDVRMGERRLLVDATVNPGNSGGPVVGENGELFGVADSILAMEQTQDVSFAVPVDVASQMLDRAGVPHDMTHYGRGQSDRRSAKTFKEAIRCTFLIVVEEEAGPSVKPEDLYLLDFETRMEKIGKGATGAASNKGKVVVDRLGRVLYTDETAQLPFLLGKPSTIGFESFPDVGNSGWRNIHVSHTTIRVPSRGREGPRSGRSGNPFGLPGGMGGGMRGGMGGADPLGGLLGGGSSERKLIGRVQVQVYQFESGDRYKKAYFVVGIDPESESVILTCATEGKVEFDGSTGFPTLSTVKGDFLGVLGGRRSAGTVTIRCEYLDAAAIANYEARLARQREEAREKAKQQARTMLEQEKQRLLDEREALEQKLRSQNTTVSKGLSKFDPEK